MASTISTERDDMDLTPPHGPDAAGQTASARLGRGARTVLGGQQPRGRKPRRGTTTIRRGLVSVIGGFALWELAVRTLEPSTVIIVAPSAVGEAFVRLIADGSLAQHIVTSMRQFALGFLLASIIAIPLGLIMGASRRAHDYGDPWLSALYATPSVALAPLFIVWLGFDDKSHIAIIALVAFFPVIINTIDGVHAVERDLREVGFAFRASRREMFWQVDLPGSMPYIFTGLRLAMARALVGVVVADLFGAKEGLGFLILTSSQLFRTADVFVGVLVLAGLGVLFTYFLRFAQRRFTPWMVEVKAQ